MPSDRPDFPDLRLSLPSRTADRHLSTLRALLQQDYLARADWEAALTDLARMACQALEAREAMVALCQPADEPRWTAVTHLGEWLLDPQISAHGSRSALEQVRRTEKPLLTMGSMPLELDSESIRRHQVESFLVVPLFWWDVTSPAPERQLGGCLYAHRTADQPPFSQADVDLMRDIARIGQPTLNMLRCLRQVRAELEASQEALARLREASAQEFRLGRFTSYDKEFARNILEPLRRVARADRVGILFLGPTGAGKTYLAEAYHNECARRTGPFVVLDCAQVTSQETLSAELFGYAPDSGYANAPRGGRPGKAALAHRGSLFVDEIGCLSAELQQKLLRLIERGEFSPLGSSEVKKVDIQVLSATNEDLDSMVRERRFREDLFWRISDLTLRLPALSERLPDIPLLARAFLSKAAIRAGRPEVEDFTPRAIQALLEHDWSQAGNIRGLERTILRSLLLAPVGVKQLDARHLKLQELLGASSSGLPGHGPLGSGRGLPRAPDSRAVTRDSPEPGGEVVRPQLAGDRGESASGTSAYPQGAPTARATQFPEPPSREHEGAGLRPKESSPRLEEIKAAIKAHGYASAAAKALGLTYRELTWQLHKVGLSVRDVLAERD